MRAALPPRRLGVVLALTGLYFVAGKLGLLLAFVHPSATAVWPPAGIALAAVLLLGRDVWPGIFLGAFLVNVTIAGGGGPLVSLAVAGGNTLEALAGAYLVQRYAGGTLAFDHADDVIKYTLLAALGSTVIAATVGVASLVLGGAAPPGGAGIIWLTWWLGDVGGDVVVAPLILLLRAPSYGIEWDLRRTLEAALLATLAFLAAEVVFGSPARPAGGGYPLDFLIVPVLVWAAFRFGRRGAAVANALVYAVAVDWTRKGDGPFGSFAPNDALLLLQVFTTVVAVTALTVAATVLERRRVEQRLLSLAVSDPLTGLANYRRLMEVLETEVERSLRSGRPFSVLFLDVDHLKKVNDRHGHLVGSRALVRLAEVLRRACRAIDTPARYGGDEFAVVLPEADEAAATLVGQRVKELLAADRESPRITASMGVGVFPRDADSANALLGAADEALYGAKGRARAR